MVERLLKPFGVKAGAEPDMRCAGGATAMMYAAYRNHASVVRVLIQHGADMSLMDDEGMTALLFAVQGRLQSPSSPGKCLPTH